MSKNRIEFLHVSFSINPTDCKTVLVINWPIERQILLGFWVNIFPFLFISWWIRFVQMRILRALLPPVAHSSFLLFSCSMSKVREKSRGYIINTIFNRYICYSYVNFSFNTSEFIKFPKQLWFYLGNSKEQWEIGNAVFNY